MTALQEATREAHSRGLEVTRHAGTGSTLIDGMRWDFWMRLRDRETTAFRGKQLVKEK